MNELAPIQPGDTVRTQCKKTYWSLQHEWGHRTGLFNPSWYCVYDYLLFYANEKSGYTTSCGIDRIAQFTNLSTRQVKTTIAALIEYGFLERVSKGTPNKSSVYRIRQRREVVKTFREAITTDDEDAAQKKAAAPTTGRQERGFATDNTPPQKDILPVVWSEEALAVFQEHDNEVFK